MERRNLAIVEIPSEELMRMLNVPGRFLPTVRDQFKHSVSILIEVDCAPRTGEGEELKRFSLSEIQELQQKVKSLQQEQLCG
jgi:hypothetical protein